MVQTPLHVTLPNGHTYTFDVPVAGAWAGLAVLRDLDTAAVRYVYNGAWAEVRPAYLSSTSHLID